MARFNRPSVKVALIAGLLSSAGAGTYVVTTSGGGWLAQLRGAGELEIEPVSDSAQQSLSKSDFAAIESVWGQNATASTPPAEVPTVVEAAEPVTDDRYNVEPTVAAREVAEVAEEHIVPKSEAPEDAVTKGVASNDIVTRGQEPDDYGDAQPQAAIAADGVESSRRAREAFSEDVAATPVPVAAGDRYGADSGATAEPTPPVSAGATNPFAEPTAAAPIATHSPAAIENEPAELRTAKVYRSVPDQQPSAGNADLAPTPYETQAASPGEGTGHPGEQALEGAQKPALLIQKFAPPEIQVRKAAKFAIQVRNVGGQTAENVVVRDEVPAGTELVNTTPKAISDGSHLVWELGSLSTGEERTLEIELMPIKEGEIGSVASVTCAARASVKTRCTEPQLAIRMTAPKQVMIGQEQRVKIELRNPGSGDATGVMLLENVPQNVKHAAGPALEFEVGTLRAGETREMELVLTAEKAGPVENMLIARADGNLQVKQSLAFEVIAPDLKISVDGPKTRYLERPATYQVSIENPGTAPAHDIELVTKLPKGMQFVKANNMGEYDAATHSVYWSLAQLPEGESGAVELVAMPVEPGQQTIEVEGRAQQGLIDEAKQEVQVEGIAALMFEVRDLEDPIEVKGETTYEIRVVNQGSKAASNVCVAIELPPGLEAVSASGETRHEVQARGVKFEPIAQLAPKTDSVFRVQIRGTQPGDQRVNVTVNSDEFSQPISREESTRVFGDE